MVARPQSAALREVARTYNELSSLGIKNQQLIVNGVFPETAVTENDKLSHALYSREQAALESMPEALRSLPVDILYLQNCSGQLKLATVLEFFRYRFSDSLGGNPPLYSCGLSSL